MFISRDLKMKIEKIGLFIRSYYQQNNNRQNFLGTVHDSSTVGTVPASSSISSSNSRGSSRGKASNVDSSSGSQVSIATIAIAKTIGVSSIGSGITQAIGTSIAETSIAIGSVVGISLSFSLSLGDVDNSGRVGDIPSSSSIASSKGGESSRGETIDADGSRGAHASVASSVAETIGVGSVGTSVGVAGIASKAIAIGSVVGVSIGLSHGASGQTHNSQEFVHVEYFVLLETTTHWSS